MKPKVYQLGKHLFRCNRPPDDSNPNDRGEWQFHFKGGWFTIPHNSVRDYLNEHVIDNEEYLVPTT